MSIFLQPPLFTSTTGHRPFSPLLLFSSTFSSLTSIPSSCSDSFPLRQDSLPRISASHSHSESHSSLLPHPSSRASHHVLQHFYRFRCCLLIRPPQCTSTWYFFPLSLPSTGRLTLCAGTITGVTGANGVQAAGFGIIASTPRDGSTRKPFEQDTSVIRDNEITSGKAGVCGRTAAGGSNDVAAQLAAASQAGLPTAAADGSVTMTLHQVNGDGAGPYTCDVSGDGGNTFQAATVTQQVPGKNGRSQAKATDFALTAQLPAGMACTAGPNGDACILRCRNPSNAGPFGSCVAVSQGAAAGNTTATGAGKTARDAPAKRYISSRVAGKRSGYWLDNQ
ncbi:hypothetical protein B0H17DRAFT_939051 [Mycena rosella]|uniref:Uncharacterized protein n=1 Tax=Mycena rosella TaxID=1033263 RepID=A0AAD7GCB8_MYCRO|nr:hypothetical protein B0H17DRAFT_939051 [Mycena rosella]